MPPCSTCASRSAAAAASKAGEGRHRHEVRAAAGRQVTQSRRRRRQLRPRRLLSALPCLLGASWRAQSPPCVPTRPNNPARNLGFRPAPDTPRPPPTLAERVMPSTSKSFHLRSCKANPTGGGGKEKRNAGEESVSPRGPLSVSLAGAAPARRLPSLASPSWRFQATAAWGSRALPVVRRRVADGPPPAGRPGKGPPRRPDCREPGAL